MSSHAGRSRVEVVVGLLIVALVTGLVAVGAVRMREEAARMSCANNLKQLGIACHSYHDANNRLPPLVDLGEGAPTGRGLPSVFAILMPHIEASPRYYRQGMTPSEYHADSSVPFTFRYKDSGTGTDYGGAANQFHWRTFIDPADKTGHQLRDIPMTLPDGTTGYYATGSYAANGLLPWGTKGLRDGFPNGTSNTILLAERPQVCRDATGNTTYNLWGVGFYSPHMPAFATLTPTDPPGLSSTGQVAPALPLSDEHAADRDSLIQVRIGRRDANPQPPDFPTPIQLLARNKPCDTRLPASPHRAGMQVAMADGSVRVFAPDTAAWVFWSACTPGGEGRDR
jgi:hypothetical protein